MIDLQIGYDSSLMLSLEDVQVDTNPQTLLQRGWDVFTNNPDDYLLWLSNLSPDEYTEFRRQLRQLVGNTTAVKNKENKNVTN